ncbi:hypothetical protein Pla52o_13990 [Novipirellula galeiformis]|uniref:Sporadically distributed protein, TIGR04141 family n=1 Tax=Novipirellula galeiformis TaxID=2528004 RepID=A0A5C6CNZ4_9BACT|nr:DUF6119 family protein [Novipirellula galeiformis]TWU25101.1 hypothetical protein Pla52o_13990 [Novipirellula galeiformis]
MATKGIPTAKLNVLLLKAKCKSFKDALRDGHTLAETKLKSTIGVASTLYTKTPHQNPPSWAKFLRPIAKGELRLGNASSSAILFVKSAGRIFAFCFGQGRSELKNDIAEPAFGLKVALNTVDAAKLRSADARTLEHGVTTRRLQTSRNADQTAFGFDVSRELLRQIAGQPDDPTIGTKVVGTDALTLHARITAGGLGKKCEQLLKAYQSKKYKDQFEWVDHLTAVNDRGIREKLDEKLVKEFTNGDRENMHLAATSIVDWEAVESFKLGGAGRTEFVDLDLETYVSQIKKLDEISLQRLKNYQVKAKFAGGTSHQRQSNIYSSLVWETRHAGKMYALVDGSWYAIDSNYAETVAKFIQAIPIPDPDHLPNTTLGEVEGDYNERAAEESDELFMLDKLLVRPEGASTSIEFCDLFSKAKQLIHVKRKTRSATLSHLFAQGVVSAELFLQDPEVRNQVKDHIRDHAPNGGFLGHIPNGRPNAGDYEVVYGIAAKPNNKWPLSLPFFSQVNLMTACKRLDALGFRYSLVLIEAS